MKIYQTYVCETCGFESRNHEEVELCEAKHIGLTNLEDKHAYDSLKMLAEYCGSVISKTKNEETEKAFDEAINKLIAFEKEHGILS